MGVCCITPPMPITIRAVILSLLFLCFALPGFACEANWASSSFQGDMAAGGMTDFAYILRSSQVAGCEQAARNKLMDKLNSMDLHGTLWPQDHPWKRPWSGVSLSFALSSGLILGARGYLD